MIQAFWKTYYDAQEDIARIRNQCGAEAYSPGDDETLHVVAYQDGAPIATGRARLDGEPAEIDLVYAIAGDVQEGARDLLIRMLCAGAIKSGAKNIAITAGLEMEKLILPLGFIRAGETIAEETGMHTGYYAARADTVSFNTCGGRGN